MVLWNLLDVSPVTSSPTLPRCGDGFGGNLPCSVLSPLRQALGVPARSLGQGALPDPRRSRMPSAAGKEVAAPAERKADSLRALSQGAGASWKRSPK